MRMRALRYGLIKNKLLKTWKAYLTFCILFDILKKESLLSFLEVIF